MVEDARCNYYPRRGDARDTFRCEIRGIWKAITDARDPVARAWTDGLWVLDGELFLVHTRKLTKAMEILSGSRTRKKSSVNAMLNGGFGCKAQEGGVGVLDRVFPGARGLGRERWQWTLRTNAEKLFGGMRREECGDEGDEGDEREECVEGAGMWEGGEHAVEWERPGSGPGWVTGPEAMVWEDDMENGQDGQDGQDGWDVIAWGESVGPAWPSGAWRGWWD